MLWLLGWLLFGLVAGAIARLLVPGRQNIGWLLTIVLGVVGSFVGGFLYNALFGNFGEFTASGMIGSVIGAVVVLLVYLYATKGKITT